MRAALIVAVAALAFAPQVPAAQAPAQAGPKVQIRFEPGGLVTLESRDATLREILAEWSRQGGSYFVGSERLPATPMTLQFASAPERDVMASLLRQAAGYVLGPRRAGSIGISSFEVVYILPTSNPSAGGYTPPPVTQFQQQITLGSPDDEIPPVGRGVGAPAPAPQPGPQPGPEYRPATPAGSGVAVPVIAIPSGGATPPPSTTPTPPAAGRGGNPPGAAGS